VTTDKLIDLIVKDSRPTWRFSAALTVAVLAAVLLAGFLFFAAIGFRPDIAEALKSGRFLFKFLVTGLLAVTAGEAVSTLGHPDGQLAHKGIALAIAPALLIFAALIELFVVPQGEWVPRAVGHNARLCLTLIPLLAIGPLGCFLVALRHGAPSNPGYAGAVAGLAASGIAATFYAANCTDDSPLFVLAWYPIPTLILTVGGFLVGRRLLRW
jgi:hypothetical protein